MLTSSQSHRQTSAIKDKVAEVQSGIAPAHSDSNRREAEETGLNRGRSQLQQVRHMKVTRGETKAKPPFL